MTELLSSGHSDVRWPELLRIADGDDIASMLRRLLDHGQQLLPMAGLSVWLPGPADPLDAMLEDSPAPPDGPTDALDAPTGRSTLLVGAHLAAGLDRVQAALGEGPACHAMAEAAYVSADVNASSGRWPRFADAASDVGVRCTASVPLLRADGSCAGVLNAYAGEPLPDSSTPILLALGAHASVILETVAVYLEARGDAVRLRNAMLTSSIIEQAKGVLIMRERITAELADEYLRKTSEVTRREIRDIASELVSRAAKGTLR